MKVPKELPDASIEHRHPSLDSHGNGAEKQYMGPTLQLTRGFPPPEALVALPSLM
jgi:hypothetical protein